MGELKRISFKLMKHNKALSVALLMSILITVFMVVSMFNYSINIKEYYKESISGNGEKLIEIQQNEQHIVGNLQKHEGTKSGEKLIANYLLFLCVLVVLIATMLISSVFYRYLDKSNKNIAILRMIGANAANIYEIMLCQSFAINIGGCTFGFISAWICHKPLLELFGKEEGWIGEKVTFYYFFSILLTLFIFSIMQLCMIQFLKRCIEKLPMENMQEEIALDFLKRTPQDDLLCNKKSANQRLSIKKCRQRKLKGRAGFGLFSLLYYFIVIMLYIYSHDVFLPMILCLLFLLITFYLYTNDLIMWIFKVIVKLTKKMKDTYGYIAFELIQTQVRENSYIILTIMFLFIFSFVGNNLFHTIKSNSEKYYREKYLKEIIITPLGTEEIAYRKVQEIENKLKESKYNPITIYNNYEIFPCINQKTIPNYIKSSSFDLLYEDKIMKTLVDSEEVIIGKRFAERYHVKIGDTIQLINRDDIPRDQYGNLNLNEKIKKERVELKIAEIVDIYGVDVLVDCHLIDLSSDSITLDRMFVSDEDGNVTGELLLKVNELSVLNKLEWNSYQDEVALETKLAKQELGLFSICINIVFIVICFGMLNTLNNILQNYKKEYRILRQIGASRVSIIRIMFTQIVSYSFIGIVLGVLFGYFITININFADTKSLQLDFSIVQVLSLVGILGAFTLGTIPTIRKVIKEIG